MKIKLISLAVALMLCYNDISAQAEAEQTRRIARNTYQITFGGLGCWYSANYERILQRTERSFLIARAGLGQSEYYATFSDGYAIAIPTQVSFNYGGRNAYFESGLGFTPVFSDASSATSLYAIFGLRLQKQHRLSPIYRITSNIRTQGDRDIFYGFISLSVGLSF